jgi:hypothetical protein
MSIIFFGITLLILSIWGMFSYWWSFLEIVRGLLPFLGLLLGIVLIGAGIRSSTKRTAEE